MLKARLSVTIDARTISMFEKIFFLANRLPGNACKIGANIEG